MEERIGEKKHHRAMMQRGNDQQLEEGCSRRMQNEGGSPWAPVTLSWCVTGLGQFHAQGDQATRPFPTLFTAEQPSNTLALLQRYTLSLLTSSAGVATLYT